MMKTPDLSQSYNPVPKVYRAKKTPKPMKKIGSRTQAWLTGQPKLKELFKSHGIISCELMFEGCLGERFLGFAHAKRRVNYNEEELVDPHNVVLACQQCHTTLDQEMPKAEAEKLAEIIIKGRGW